MKNKTRGSVLLSLILPASVAVGCGAQPGDSTDPVTGEVENALTTTDYTDGTGRVVIRVFQCDWVGPAAHNQTSCTVGSGFVLVGGGAEVAQGNQAHTPYPQPGALLTQSEPSPTLLTWLAGSKDHQFSDSHFLRAYAIGMRIKRPDGTFLSAADVMTQIYLSLPSDSTQSPHPSVTADISNSFSFQFGDIRLGGGAHVVGSPDFNQLLTSSFPAGSTQWSASSKDHFVSAPGIVEAVAIGIHPCAAIYGGGCLNAQVFSSGSVAVGTGYREITRNIGSPFATVSIGGISSYNGPGRLLVNMIPNMSTANGVRGGSTITTKDHGAADTGNIEANLVGLTFN
jgi:hypothetical protein